MSICDYVGTRRTDIVSKRLDILYVDIAVIARMHINYIIIIVVVTAISTVVVRFYLRRPDWGW